MLRLTSVFVTLSLTLSACGSSLTGINAGRAGGSGGGTAGGFGGGATAGGGAVVDGGLAPCGPPSSLLQFEATLDGRTLGSGRPGTIEADVSVLDATRTDAGVQRLRFMHDGGMWEVDLELPNAPALAQVGDSLQVVLVVEDTREGVGGGYRKRIQLARSGVPFLFMHFNGRPSSEFATAPVWGLGLTLTEGTSLCKTEAFPCGRLVKSVGLTLDGGAPVFVDPGGTVRLGPFDLTVDAFEAAVDTGNCDWYGTTFLGGLRVR
jgi:hypothetical protein